MHISLYAVNIYVNLSIHRGKPDGKFRDRIHIMKGYFDRFLSTNSLSGVCKKKLWPWRHFCRPLMIDRDTKIYTRFSNLKVVPMAQCIKQLSVRNCFSIFKEIFIHLSLKTWAMPTCFTGELVDNLHDLKYM